MFRCIIFPIKLFPSLQVYVGLNNLKIRVLGEGLTADVNGSEDGFSELKQYAKRDELKSTDLNVHLMVIDGLKVTCTLWAALASKYLLFLNVWLVIPLEKTLSKVPRLILINLIKS
ncbi:uncharacterized protein [Rutidosis leptorrhynchoides]|uniref:uncharacterized protein isoform X1 n=1 Tax=Rutidosis leptorrhynchoides TaxID=125765 RepID=UPI003A98D0C7